MGLGFNDYLYIPEGKKIWWLFGSGDMDGCSEDRLWGNGNIFVPSYPLRWLDLQTLNSSLSTPFLFTWVTHALIFPNRFLMRLMTPCSESGFSTTSTRSYSITNHFSLSIINFINYNWLNTMASVKSSAEHSHVCILNMRRPKEWVIVLK